MMTRRNWYGTAAGLALSFICAGAVAQDSKTFVMKLATATLNDGQHEWMNRFSAAIAKNTDGRIKAEVYPASQLGAIPRMIEGTQLGSIQAFGPAPPMRIGEPPLLAPSLFPVSLRGPSARLCSSDRGRAKRCCRLHDSGHAIGRCSCVKPQAPGPERSRSPRPPSGAGLQV